MVWKRVEGRASLPLRILWCESAHVATLKKKKGGAGGWYHSLITIRGVLGGHQHAGAEGRCTQLPVVDQYTDEHSSGALVY